jgi:hypothetical protein
MAPNDFFGIVIQKQSKITADLCRGHTVTVEIKKKLETATAVYFLL